jgi:hypothetical protein
MNNDYLCPTACMLDTPVLFYDYFASMTMTNITTGMSEVEVITETSLLVLP